MCAHHERKAQSPLQPGSRARLRSLEALEVFDALLCYLSLILKRSDTKLDIKKPTVGQIFGGRACCVVPPPPPPPPKSTTAFQGKNTLSLVGAILSKPVVKIAIVNIMLYMYQLFIGIPQ